MLTGSFPRILDEKQRIAVPKRLRQSISDPEPAAVFITPGFDGSLIIYGEVALQGLAEKFSQTFQGNQDARAFQRLFYAQAQHVEFDSQGRIRIPAELLEWAKMGNEVVLIGVQDHMELWDKNAWAEYLAKKLPSYDELADKVYQSAATNKTT
jgi:MraZ protein